jgi:RNA polymerase sigma factor (sigma-70 family)
VTPVSIPTSLLRGLCPDSDAACDADLLARYARGRDEAAFGALYRRHGPMVRAVCRRQCRDPHLAADAEQGVWIVLARKPAAVSRPDRLANWLFGVAIRVARKAATSARRVPPPRSEGVAADVAVSAMADELLRVLDEELAALSEAERLPLVLCYLEGRTQDEAARACGTCVRTIRRQLERGRKALRERLERRGVAPAAAFAALALAPPVGASPGVVPTALAGGSVPPSLSLWIAEDLAMTGAAWWVRVAVVAGLGLGAAATLAAVRFEEPRPVPSGTAAEKGAVVRLGNAAFRHKGGVEGLAFTADGQRLAAFGPQAVSVWAVPSGQVAVSTGDRDKGYRHLSVTSPDGRLAVELFNRPADAEQGSLYDARVTDLTTGKSAGGFLATYGEAQPGPYSLSGAISPDGKTLAIQYCAEVSLYALPDGKLLHRLADGGRVFRHVAFTPDGTALVVGSLDDLTLTVWDVANGTKGKTLTAEGQGTGGLSVSPDGKTVAAAVNRQQREKTEGGGSQASDHPESVFVVWDLGTGQVVKRFAADAPVRAVACMPDGTVVGVVDPVEARGRSGLRRWNLTTDKVVWSADAAQWVSALARSPDGKLLATASQSASHGGGFVRVWDAATGKVRGATEMHSWAVTSAAFAADGKTVRTTDGAELRTWDAATGRALDKFTHPELVGYARWDATGRFVAAGVNAAGDDRRTVAVFDTATGKKLLSVGDSDRESGFGSRTFDLSADGTRLCLPVTKDKALLLRMWDVPNAKIVWTAPMPAGWTPGAVVIAGDRVLAGSRPLLVLDAASGKELTRWDLVKSGVLPADTPDFTLLYPHPSRDGRTLGYVVPKAGVFLVDTQTGKLIRRIEMPEEVHAPLAFTPDGTRFATVWGETGVCVWETTTGRKVTQLDGAPSRVIEVAFAPDGKRLAAGCIDGTAVVWDIGGLK